MNAQKNTLLAQVQNAIVANAADAATYRHDDNAEKKAKRGKRNADLKHGAKNAQPDTGKPKGRVTRIKAGKVNVSELLTKPMTRADGSESIQDACDAIKAAHNSLEHGQITQLDAFIVQGHALITIKAKLVQDAENEKQADRAFGAALKTAGIGADIIPRDARQCFVWLAENESDVRAFINDALNASLDMDSATKEQKSIARKYKAVKLSPYIIKAAMTKETKEAAEDTLAKIVDNAITRADKLGIDKAELIRAIQSA